MVVARRREKQRSIGLLLPIGGSALLSLSLSLSSNSDAPFHLSLSLQPKPESLIPSPSPFSFLSSLCCTTSQPHFLFTPIFTPNFHQVFNLLIQFQGIHR
ncbi:Phospholipid-transporting ATPase 1 isoform D [Glycine soja]|uniref:Phospholipid-transporting ATPase 1 isoform D n=1 Tax=Glycine soja TaxID=3848 RepID=A0A445FVV7_GLYSO|nr:Phospholipid-transporting ATPase 1 isoform D [Glycine soja]